MVEWLDINIQFWHWIVLGFLLAALEIILPTFFMLWLGVSAIVVGVVLWLVPLSIAAQIFIWVVLSLVCLIAWFVWVAPRMQDKSRSGMAMESIVGRQATVLEYQLNTQRGRLRFSAPVLGDDEWNFICETAVKPGDRVGVVDFSGNDLLVNPHT